MTDPYTTFLNKSQETAYQLWRKRLPTDLQNDGDYDLRGAFLNNAKEAGNGHLPDTFKKPNHITFSDASQYHNADTPGGRWEDTGLPNEMQPGQNKWVFWASPHNIANTNPTDLQKYFNENEKGNIMIIPSNYSLPGV